MPELLVVVLQTLPVVAELVEAVLVDVFQPVGRKFVSAIHSAKYLPVHLYMPLSTPGCLHAGSASGDLPAFLHAVELAGAVGLGLAHHVVVIVRLAPGADEERSGQKRSGTGANFLDLGDVVGQRGGVDQHLLVESAEREVSAAVKGPMDDDRDGVGSGDMNLGAAHLASRAAMLAEVRVSWVMRNGVEVIGANVDLSSWRLPGRLLPSARQA